VSDPIGRALGRFAPGRPAAGGGDVFNLGKPPVPYVGRQQNGAGTSVLLRRDGRDREAELAQMSSLGTLFGLISRLADAVSSDRHRWHLHQQGAGKCELCGEDGVTLVVGGGPMLDVWNRPNPHFYGQLFRETIQQHIDLTGEFYWVVVDVLGVPVELWPVKPSMLTPVTSRTEYLLGWVYTGPDGEQVPLLARQVIQGRMPDPSDPYRGMGPLGALAPDLAGARMAAEWNAQFFKNSAIPGGIIEFEEAMGDTDYEQFVTRWRELHQGVGNAHRVAIIERGKWVDRNYSQRDMEFTSLRTMSGDIIREAYGFPKFAQGIVEDVNRASAEASDDFFARWLVVPRLDRIRNVLNEILVPLFGTMGRGQSFGYVSPIKGDQETDAKVLEQRTRAFATLVTNGVDPVEAADACGLPDMGLKAVTQGEITNPEQLALLVQKVYLGVDKVITWEESRALLASAGFPLDPNAKKPEPAPAPGFGRPGQLPPADGPGDGGPVDFSAAIGWYEEQARVPVAWLEGEIVDEVPEWAQRVQDDWRNALDALERQWSAISGTWADALLDAGESALEALEPATLAVLDITAAPDLADAVQVLVNAMTDVAEKAAQRVAQEARAQGVEIHPVLPSGNTLGLEVNNNTADRHQVVAAGAFQQIAEASAALLASGLAQAIGGEMLRWFGSGRDARQIRQQVKGWLTDNPGTSGLRTRLGGLLTRAQNRARIATMTGAGSTVPVRWFASEVLDGNTCNPCKKINGNRLPTLEAMLLAYGGTGGYLLCEGRERCRGMPVARWGDED
jgi:phage portal protein BeeE